jgi:hypothetical protein
VRIPFRSEANRVPRFGACRMTWLLAEDSAYQPRLCWSPAGIHQPEMSECSRGAVRPSPSIRPRRSSTLRSSRSANIEMGYPVAAARRASLLAEQASTDGKRGRKWQHADDHAGGGDA